MSSFMEDTISWSLLAAAECNFYIFCEKFPPQFLPGFYLPRHSPKSLSPTSTSHKLLYFLSKPQVLSPPNSSLVRKKNHFHSLKNDFGACTTLYFSWNVFISHFLFKRLTSGSLSPR